jgi:apolipoprotein N-acyltransferase
MFRSPLITFAPGYKGPPNAMHSPEQIASYGPGDLAALARRLDTAVLVGVDRVHFPAAAGADTSGRLAVRYNAAALAGRDGKIVGTYDKIHRVMFGEYIPFAEYLPFLYQITPLTGGIAAGLEPAALCFGDSLFVAPSICYETAIPHVIRRQVATLHERGAKLDALVNVTNDAWYWGSSELDMHLACGVFRAVESRLPLVIAANGGLSAWIDEYGHVRSKSPRQQSCVLIADIGPVHLRSFYVRTGDWFAAVCLACCLVLAVAGWRWRREPSATSAA